MHIEELRQRLGVAKADYQGPDADAVRKAMDDAVERLRIRYGTEVPAAEAILFLRRTAAEATEHQAPAAPGTSSREPAGVDVAWTPAGFLLRESCRSLGGALYWTVLAAVLCLIPFRLFPDLICGLPTDTGPSFWLTTAFLTAWAACTLYVAAMGAVGLFGEIRIAKTGDEGEVFTGIGPFGRTYRFRWSEFYGTGGRSVASSSRISATTIHYIGLNGKTRRYRFGSELDASRQAVIIGFLREHVFGIEPRPEPAPEEAPSGGATVSLERVRRSIEEAKLDYCGPEPEAFHQAADVLLSSLRAGRGERVPVADAVEVVRRLGQMPGAQISFRH
jgi:hypothetical protein